jgi:hypothetical protein
MSWIDSWHWTISTGRHFQNGRLNTAQIQHCPISTTFHMWVDYDVPKWFNKVWETYCFCSVSYYYFSYYYYYSPFFPRTMNLSTADLRNYWTEFRETWWSYIYMFLVGLKVFSFVVKGVKVIFWGVQKGWGLL